MIGRLFFSQLYQLKGWFRDQTLVKCLVIVILLSVLSVVTAAIFLIAYNFFGYMHTYEQFGLAVAQYSLNAGLLITVLLTIISAIFVNLRRITSSDNRHLVSLPIDSRHLFWAQLFFGALQSAWPTLIVLAPLFMAYYAGFRLPFTVLALAVTLTVIILLSQALGMMVAVFLTGRWGPVRYRSNLVIAAVGILGIVMVARLLFPPQFFRLYDAQTWQTFQTGLAQLPINAPFSITYWLTHLATDGFNVANLLVVGSLGSVIGAILFAISKYYHRALIKGYRSTVVAGDSSWQARRPRIAIVSPYRAVLKNEFLWFTNHAEASYAIFIALITAFLLLVVRYIPIKRAAQQGWHYLAATILFIAVSYMGLLFANRYLFPNLTKDRGKLWIFFSAPLKRLTLFDVKVALSLLTLLVWITVGILSLFVFSTAYTPPTEVFALLISQSLLCIFLLQFATGVVFPAHNPHTSASLASTSVSGVMAVLVSFSTTGILAAQLYAFLTQNTPLNSLLIITLVSLHALWFLVAYTRFSHMETV